LGFTRLAVVPNDICLPVPIHISHTNDAPRRSDEDRVAGLLDAEVRDFAMTQAPPRALRIARLTETTKDESSAVRASQYDVSIEFSIAGYLHTDPTLVCDVAGFDIDWLLHIVVSGRKIDSTPKGIASGNPDVYCRLNCLLDKWGIICSAQSRAEPADVDRSVIQTHPSAGILASDAVRPNYCSTVLFLCRSRSPYEHATTAVIGCHKTIKNCWGTVGDVTCVDRLQSFHGIHPVNRGSTYGRPRHLRFGLRISAGCYTSRAPH
jgi:hypothetical protein